MKTTASKENSTPSHSSQPFFSKKGEGGFFAQTEAAEQPFFAPAISRQAAVGGGGNAQRTPFFQARPQPLIQPKLTINEPGDKYEQEADSMADRVMRMSETPVGKTVQTRPSPISLVQRKCAACEEEKKLQRQEMEEEEPLQTKPLMRKAAGGGYTASPQLTSQLNSSKGGGDPLPGKTLISMSQAFGSDFSKVRVHTGTQAAEMSQGIQAKAFTHGSDIYFNRGQYSPESSEGKRLLGHELTHVVQQGTSNKDNGISRKNISKISEFTIQRDVWDVITWPAKKGREIAWGAAKAGAKLASKLNPLSQYYELLANLSTANLEISNAKSHIAGKSTLYFSDEPWDTIQNAGSRLNRLIKLITYPISGLSLLASNIFSRQGVIITGSAAVVAAWAGGVVAAAEASALTIYGIPLAVILLIVALLLLLVALIILIVQAIRRSKPCPPCPPNPPKEVDIVPPAATHYPCPGSHWHYRVYNQNPQTCQCFLSGRLFGGCCPDPSVPC